MTLDEIAEALVAGCRAGRETENLDRLYAEDAVSVEPVDWGTGRETLGREGIRGKHAWWEETFETLTQTVSGPFTHGEDRFAVIFEVTARHRDSGETNEMREVAVYHVAQGQIVREEFFTETGG